jgi:hypothetical protein
LLFDGSYMEERRMPKINSGGDKRREPRQPVPERRHERSSPGSGEDEEEDGGQAADLQPDDVEAGDPAR